MKINNSNSKLKIFTILLLFVMSYLLSSCSYQKVNNANMTLVDEMDAYINAFNDICSKNQYSGNVLIQKEGNIIFEKSYGMSDYEENIPLNEDTIFRIGSITKTIVAIAILQLNENGLLNINDPISDYVPLKQEDISITIKNLLNHTSGISRDHILDLGNKDKKIYLPINSEPGTEWHYSNVGYKLLAYIIESVSGMPYDEYLRKNIFEPINMTNTYCNVPDDKVPTISPGHLLSVNIRKGYDVSESLLVGSGEIYSTTYDLMLLFNALHNEKILTKESLDQMIIDNTDLMANYGYGLELGAFRGHKWYGHGGAIVTGYRSMVLHFPDDNITVILLLNIYFENIIDMMLPLAAIAMGEDYDMPVIGKEVNMTSAELENYTGDYKISDGFIITIKKFNDNYLQIVPADTQAIFIPYSKNEFVARGLEFYKLEFNIDNLGNVKGLTLKTSVDEKFEAEKIIN